MIYIYALFHPPYITYMVHRITKQENKCNLRNIFVVEVDNSTQAHIKSFENSINSIDINHDIYDVLGTQCAYCSSIFKSGDTVLLFRCQHALHESCSDNFIHACALHKRLALCPTCNCVLIAPIIKQTVDYKPTKQNFLLRFINKIFKCMI